MGCAGTPLVPIATPSVPKEKFKSCSCSPHPLLACSQVDISLAGPFPPPRSQLEVCLGSW